MNGLPGYFLAPDASGDDIIWRARGDFPVPVIGRLEMHDDPELWDAIVTLVKGEAS